MRPDNTHLLDRLNFARATIEAHAKREAMHLNIIIGLFAFAAMEAIVIAHLTN
ncbi:MAG TPA: hypothetical protein VM783_18015 [Candidatus Acidoferrum sp.]|nr:hypothetical protein [Candidatus Acidoferrum sp.]